MLICIKKGGGATEGTVKWNWGGVEKGLRKGFQEQREACAALKTKEGFSVHQVIKGKGEKSSQQPEQSGTSHRAMSHLEVLVQLQVVCEPGAREAGSPGGRRGGAGWSWIRRDLANLCALPPPHSQTKRGSWPARC